MKLKSRSTLGVFFGGLQIFGFLVIAVYIIVVLIKLKDLSSQDAEFRDDDVAQWYSVLLYILLVVCLIVTFTSVLLIIGIIKRRSILMKPWIYINLFGIVLTILRMIVNVFSEKENGGHSLSVILIDLLVLGLQLLIFIITYNLYTKIKKESEQST